ncbi:DUF58 domain-containing protein [Frigoribacterium sp. CFBP 13712]|uniref:DUF58 domain-containing protein n=1 Tax=Frigoribacterium sp. CFBP 13712 TaxID=2775309 RepID=UPI00178192F7|nr:DUF58 domain-containing protein [Frigoribacterium sp. CFBP 13712]
MSATPTRTSRRGRGDAGVDHRLPGATAGVTEARTRIVGGRVGPGAGAVRAAAEAAQAVRRALSGAGRAVSTLVTPLGWSVLCVVPLGLVAGYALGWTELLAIAVAALVMLVLAALSLLGRTAFEVAVVLPDDRVSVGQPLTGELRVANPTRRRVVGATVEIPVADGLVELHLPGLRAGGSVHEPFSVPTSRRGLVRVGPARTVRGDAVGLVRREIEWTDAAEVFVHPTTVGIPSTSTGFVRDLEGSPTRDLAPDDLSFHAIREYQPGDERRHIHWRSTAKTGTFMVRQFEQSRRSHLVIALSLALDDFADPEEFELAVSAAGSLGVRAIRDARDVSVVVGERTPDSARRRALAVRTLDTVTRGRLLDGLAVVEASESAPTIADVARAAGGQATGVSVAFLVVGSTTTLAALRSAAVRFPLGVEVVAIVCDAEAVPGVRRLTDLTVLTIGYLDDLRQSLARAAAS